MRREVKEALLGTMSVSGLSICRLVPLTHLTINCCMGIIVQWKTPVCIKVCYYTYEPERTKVLHKIFCDNCIKSWPSERCFKVGPHSWAHLCNRLWSSTPRIYSNARCSRVELTILPVSHNGNVQQLPWNPLFSTGIHAGWQDLYT